MSNWQFWAFAAAFMYLAFAIARVGSNILAKFPDRNPNESANQFASEQANLVIVVNKFSEGSFCFRNFEQETVGHEFILIAGIAELNFDEDWKAPKPEFGE